MGKLYAQRFIQHGWQNVYACDVPSKYQELKRQFDGTGVQVLPNGFAVVRQCDFVMFSVEATSIDKVVATFGPCMKMGSIACGQVNSDLKQK